MSIPAGTLEKTGTGAAPPPGRPSPARTSASGRRRPRRDALRMLALNGVAVLGGLAVWWALAAAGVQGLPTPGAVAAKAVTLVADGTLLTDTLASLRRVLLGFTLGTLLAVPVGFLMGWYRVARGLAEPYIQFFRTVPPLAIIPLAIVLMGIGEVPKVFVITLAAFLTSVISTFQGVVGVDSTLINAARVLGANDLVTFRRVVVPASTPFILVGMRVGLGSAWATVVAAELIAAQEGLGYMMQSAQVFYDLEKILVGLVTIGVLGLLMDRALLHAEHRLTRWQDKR